MAVRTQELYPKAMTICFGLTPMCIPQQMSPEQMAAWLQHPRLGTILSLDHTATVEIARDAGWDWLWLDAEHGRFHEQSAADACAIAQRVVPTFVRVPDKAETTLKRYLDAGADGIIVPQVSSVADVRCIAMAALYPPAGQRSVGIVRSHGYGVTFARELSERSYSIMVQIETAEGVAAIHEIAQEPAVDAVLVGPYDLSGSYGVMGDVTCAPVREAIASVLDACRRTHKPCGIFAADPAAALGYVQQGFQLVAVGMDAMMLANAHRATIAALR